MDETRPTMVIAQCTAGLCTNVIATLSTCTKPWSLCSALKTSPSQDCHQKLSWLTTFSVMPTWLTGKNSCRSIWEKYWNYWQSGCHHTCWSSLVSTNKVHLDTKTRSKLNVYLKSTWKRKLMKMKIFPKHPCPKARFSSSMTSPKRLTWLCLSSSHSGNIRLWIGWARNSRKSCSRLYLLTRSMATSNASMNSLGARTLHRQMGGRRIFHSFQLSWIRTASRSRMQKWSVNWAPTFRLWLRFRRLLAWFMWKTSSSLERFSYQNHNRCITMPLRRCWQISSAQRMIWISLCYRVKE